MARRPLQDANAEQNLVPKLIRWPADWVARIDAERGEVSFSDFVRNIVRAAVDDGSLTDPPQWGQGRPKVPEVVDVVEEIRRLTEHELSRFQKQPKKSA